MTNFEEETSNYTMKDYYKLLKWIPRSKVDRQEPCDLENATVDGESIVLPTIYEEFNGIDEVLVFINFGGISVDVCDVLLDFSPSVQGDLSFFRAECNVKDITPNTDMIIQFKLDDNIRFTDKTRVITGIQSLKLTFGTNASDITIQKVLMRCQNYTYTLTDIEQFLITGENHVLNRLGRYSKTGHVPEPLKNYIYMAGGAYAWLSRWEYEAKPMKEAKAEADNYATRLLNQVDNAIAEWIENIENRMNHDDLFHATATSVDWGLNL